MSKNNFKISPVTDLELLDKMSDYLYSLRPLLPSQRLVDHCSGALASLFELFIYLKLQNLMDYGNNKK